jgi:hypothetical protein
LRRHRSISTLRNSPVVSVASHAAKNDILVCGLSTSDRHRVRPAPEPYPDKPLVAEVTLPNGWKANLNASSAELPGAISTRAMVTLKIPF